MLGRTLAVLVAVAGLDGGLARADTRGTLRAGMMPLELVSSSDTPVFGDRMERVVDRYNAAAAAHDRAHGGTTDRIDAGDLGLAATLLVLAPGLEIGTGHYFFRLEVPIGFGDELRSIGVGVYPLNLQVAVRRGVVAYASGGAAVSWLDRTGAGDVGGLVLVRAAAGLRIAQHVIVEIGYGAFALGGSVNEDRLADMADGDAMQPIQPRDVLSAGEARGLLDASVGVAF